MSEKISRRNFLRTATLGAAAAGLLAGCGSASSSTAAGTYTAGTYSATATGINTATPVTAVSYTHLGFHQANGADGN